MELKCIRKANIELQFDVSIGKTWFEGYPQFLVSHESARQANFELVLKPLPDGSHMVMWMNANGVYGGLGIPDALIPFAGKHLSTVIRSSPTMSDDGEHWRQPEATRVWERLVAAGKAEYNEQTDVFSLI